MKKCLGGDVTKVWRITTKGIGLDDGNAFTFVRGNGCCSATGGAAADNNKVIVESVLFCHDGVLLYTMFFWWI